MKDWAASPRVAILACFVTMILFLGINKGEASPQAAQENKKTGSSSSQDQILQQLEAFNIFNQPLMVGISRKSMIYKVLGTHPAEALNGSTVLHTIALMKGANILRVHDVKEAHETIKLFGETFIQ